MGTQRTRPGSLPGGYPPGAEPFLAGIIAHRADDTPRLVFADWLQENGDEDRAEFIRAQIELQIRQPRWDAPGVGRSWEDPKGKRNPLPPDDEALHERQRGLLARYRAAWLAGHPRWAFASLLQTFRRGFPCAILAQPDQWLKDAPTLRRWFPLEEVTLQGDRGDFAGIFAAELFTGLRRVNLRGLGEVFGALADSPPLGVEALDLDARYSTTRPEPSAVRAGLGSSALAGLRELKCLSRGLGDATGSAVARSPHLRDLRLLCLADGMGEAVAVELCDSPNLANVTHLDLSSNPIGDDALRALARSAHATRIVRLGLAQAGLTADAGPLLASWPGLRSVEALDLNSNALGLDGLTALSESPYLEALRTVYIGGNVDANGFHRACALPGFARVNVAWVRVSGTWE